jgi:hypothetical protein
MNQKMTAIQVPKIQDPLLHIKQTKEITLKLKNSPPEKMILQRFNIEDTVNDGHYVMIGKRGSGKSTAVRSIVENLWKNKRIENCIVFSPTDKMNNFYSSFIQKENIYFELEPEIIENILKKQKQNKKANICVVLDDCLSSKGDFMKNLIISELLFNGRHYRITYILTMQFPLIIKPELRCNFDYVLLLADDTISNQKRIFDYYAGIFPNFDGFRQTFIQATEDYGCLCIINRGIVDSHLKVKFLNANPQYDEFYIENIYLEQSEQIQLIEKLDNSINTKNLDLNLDSNTDTGLSSKNKIVVLLENIVEINKKISNMNEKIMDMLLLLHLE